MSGVQNPFISEMREGHDSRNLFFRIESSQRRQIRHIGVGTSAELNEKEPAELNRRDHVTKIYTRTHLLGDGRDQMTPNSIYCTLMMRKTNQWVR